MCVCVSVCVCIQYIPVMVHTIKVEKMMPKYGPTSFPPACKAGVQTKTKAYIAPSKQDWPRPRYMMEVLLFVWVCVCVCE